MGHDDTSSAVTPPPIDWEVFAVFDPAGGGADFAYTVGLAAHGVPELHIWARPPEGNDPGEDWILSPQDRTRILNEVGVALIVGTRQGGDRWEEPVDGGFTMMAFHLDGPYDADELDAFGARPAPVLALHWELRRPDEPANPVPMPGNFAAHVADTAKDLRDAAAARMRVWGCGPFVAGCYPDEALDATLGDELTAVAEMLSEMRVALRSDPAALLGPLLAGIYTIDMTRAAAGVCMAAGRATGRSDMLAAARAAAAVDADMLAGHTPDGDDEWRDSVRGLLGLTLSVAYFGWVLTDVLDDSHAAAATGWVMAVLDPASAQACFDVAFNHLSSPERLAEVDDPDLDDAELVDALLEAAARCAVGGHGAPLLDSDVLAWRRLVAAGFAAAS